MAEADDGQQVQRQASVAASQRLVGIGMEIEAPFSGCVPASISATRGLSLIALCSELQTLGGVGNLEPSVICGSCVVNSNIIRELFVAGTNTTRSTVVWVMSELVRNQEVMSKIDDEMKRELIKSDKINSASHLSKLPYLQACIKEAMRLHPPVPLLLPHMAADTCEVMGYTIPKDTKVFVNLWAMGRDPKVWDDPLSFKPERFMDSKVDFKGQDFELLPFGSGRRMCPGMPSGMKSVELILASLTHEFSWSLPNGEDPSKLDMNNKFGIAMRREKPLKLVFKRK